VEVAVAGDHRGPLDRRDPVEVGPDEPDLPWPVAVEDVPYGAMLASIYAQRDSLDGGSGSNP